MAGAFEFIGRRRPLQRCLRAMKPTSDRGGVFIQGMGGLGKSTLAARLCRRVQAQRSGVQRVVLVGVVNEMTLLQKLAIAYEQYPQIPEILNQPKLSLKGRLQNLIQAVEDLDRPLLLVLDDFEQNIPASAIADRTLRPITPAAELLTAVCGAIAAMQQQMSAVSRVIVTCRYACPFPAGLHLERLERMNVADVDKKCRLLPQYGQLQRHPQYKRVLQIADGNPRLLEWLLKLLQETDQTAGVDREAMLSRLEQDRAAVPRVNFGSGFAGEPDGDRAAVFGEAERVFVARDAGDCRSSGGGCGADRQNFGAESAGVCDESDGAGVSGQQYFSYRC